MTSPPPPPTGLSLTQGRLCIVMAAVLWSMSSLFGKLLTRPTSLGLHEPPVDPWQIAFYRGLFAGLVLSLTLRRRNISFRGLMLPMGLCFATMNALFISALVLGTAANAILLQYTAPMWMYLASVWLLGERADRRSSVAVACGLAGIGVIIAGGWQGEKLPVIAIGLGSGLTYAGVLIFLRVLRTASSNWLTVWNHLAAALFLIPFMVGRPTPTWEQLGVLVLFGVVQMGIPYWLIARGLTAVSPQEAGAITLLEPLLNAVWAYLISPDTETPTVYTYAGGLLILGGLAWRYWPRRPRADTAA